MVSLQKKIAAKVLKVGVNKVWLDPTKGEDVDKAITKWDMRKLVMRGYVKAKPDKLRRPNDSKASKRTMGRREGGKHSIVSRKRKWISTIRPLRRMLKEFKSTGQIDNQTYKRMRQLTKGGVFRSRSHLKTYLEQHNLLKK